MPTDDETTQMCREILQKRYRAAKREKGGWDDVADSIDNVVSTAMVWKVANGRARSNKVAQALGIPTQRRCKANGWIRRAVWVHKDAMPLFDRMLEEHEAHNLQALVDDLMEQIDGQ